MPGNIVFRPIEANLTHNTDLIKKMNPYCTFVTGSKRINGLICKHGGKHPSWNDAIIVPIQEQRILLEVMDKDRITHDDQIGTCMIDLNEIQSQGRINKWYPLTYKNRPAGEILLAAEIEGNNMMNQEHTNTNMIQREQQEIIVNQDSAEMIYREEKMMKNQAPIVEEGTKTFVEQRQHVEPHTFMKEIDVVETRPVIQQVEVTEPRKVIKEVEYTEAVPVKKQIETIEPHVVKKEIDAMEPRLVTKTIQVVENVPVKKEVETIESVPVIKEVETFEPQTFTKQVEITEQVPVTKQITVTEPVHVKKPVEFVEPIITTETVTKEVRPEVIVNEQVTQSVGPATVIGETEMRGYQRMTSDDDNIRLLEKKEIIETHSEKKINTDLNLLE